VNVDAVLFSSDDPAAPPLRVKAIRNHGTKAIDTTAITIINLDKKYSTFFINQRIGIPRKKVKVLLELLQKPQCLLMAETSYLI